MILYQTQVIMPPQIFIHSTHERMLELIDLDTLKKYAIDL